MDINKIIEAMYPGGGWRPVGAPTRETEVRTVNEAGSTETRAVETGRHVLVITNGQSKQKLYLRSMGEPGGYPAWSLDDFDKLEAPEKGANPADVANTQATTASVTQQTDARAALEAEKDRNAAQGFGRITDADRQKLEVEAQQQGLTREQIALRAKELELSSRQRDADNNLAREKLALDAKERQLRADIEQGKLGVEQAKLEYQQQYDKWAMAQAERNAALQERQQSETERGNRERELGAANTLTETRRSNQATELGSSETRRETGRHNLATEAETARQNELQFMQQMSGDVLDSATRAVTSGFVSPTGTAEYFDAVRRGDTNAQPPAPYMFDPTQFQERAMQSAASALASISPAARAALNQATQTPSMGAGPAANAPGSGPTPGSSGQQARPQQTAAPAPAPSAQSPSGSAGITINIGGGFQAPQPRNAFGPTAIDDPWGGFVAPR